MQALSVLVKIAMEKNAISKQVLKLLMRTPSKTTKRLAGLSSDAIEKLVSKGMLRDPERLARGATEAGLSKKLGDMLKQLTGLEHAGIPRVTKSPLAKSTGVKAYQVSTPMSKGPTGFNLDFTYAPGSAAPFLGLPPVKNIPSSRQLKDFKTVLNEVLKVKGLI